MRPTVIFGTGDILVNNIAWFIRRFPIFGIPGDGRYRVRPIHVEDMARLVADAVGQSENSVLDAVGPEPFTFEELAQLIAQQLGRSVRLVHMPTTLAYLATLLIGWFVRDTILTWHEYQGLMGDLLAPEGSSTGLTRLSQWLAENRKRIGMRYASEVARHYTRPCTSGNDLAHGGAKEGPPTTSAQTANESPCLDAFSLLDSFPQLAIHAV